MNKENKPCPFCGSEDLSIEDSHVFWIGCMNCFSQGPIGDTLEEAWEKWNKRSEENG